MLGERLPSKETCQKQTSCDVSLYGQLVPSTPPTRQSVGASLCPPVPTRPGPLPASAAEYADRKNDETDEYVANSLLYDRRHLPRTAPAPECVQRAAAQAAAQQAAAAAAPGAAASQPAT